MRDAGSVPDVLPLLRLSDDGVATRAGLGLAVSVATRSSRAATRAVRPECGRRRDARRTAPGREVGDAARGVHVVFTEGIGEA
jgi:hypothetical protein